MKKEKMLLNKKKVMKSLITNRKIFCEQKDANVRASKIERQKAYLIIYQK